MKKFFKKLAKFFGLVVFDDLPTDKPCNPNEPCRGLEPRKTLGIKKTIKF